MRNLDDRSRRTLVSGTQPQVCADVGSGDSATSASLNPARRTACGTVGSRILRGSRPSGLAHRSCRCRYTRGRDLRWCQARCQRSGPARRREPGGVKQPTAWGRVDDVCVFQAEHDARPVGVVDRLDVGGDGGQPAARGRCLAAQLAELRGTRGLRSAGYHHRVTSRSPAALTITASTPTGASSVSGESAGATVRWPAETLGPVVAAGGCRARGAGGICRADVNVGESQYSAWHTDGTTDLLALVDEATDALADCTRELETSRRPRRSI
jgi:hypothetical protein